MANLDATPAKGNILEFPATTSVRLRQASEGNPWQRLTADLVKAKAARGDLEPAVLDALLLAAGVAP
jgi:hypothetical protein